MTPEEFGYFRMMDHAPPDNRAAILDRLCAEEILSARSNSRYDITNVGAILFGQDLNRFDRLPRKALRMTNATLRERLGISGDNYTAASRIIRDAIDVNLVKPHGERPGSKEFAGYLPFWA